MNRWGSWAEFVGQKRCRVEARVTVAAGELRYCLMHLS